MAKQGLFLPIPEAAVQVNFASNLARYFKTPEIFYDIFENTYFLLHK